MYLKFDFLTGCHWQFDCFKQPSLAVLYTYTSMFTANIFKGVNAFII